MRPVKGNAIGCVPQPWSPERSPQGWPAWLAMSYFFGSVSPKVLPQVHSGAISLVVQTSFFHFNCFCFYLNETFHLPFRSGATKGKKQETSHIDLHKCFSFHSLPNALISFIHSSWSLEIEGHLETKGRKNAGHLTKDAFNYNFSTCIPFQIPLGIALKHPAVVLCSSWVSLPTKICNFMMVPTGACQRMLQQGFPSRICSSNHLSHHLACLFQPDQVIPGCPKTPFFPKCSWPNHNQRWVKLHWKNFTPKTH